MTDNTFVEYAFDSLLLDQKFIESEESHYIRNEDLLRGVTFVFENDTLE